MLFILSQTIKVQSHFPHRKNLCTYCTLISTSHTAPVSIHIHSNPKNNSQINLLFSSHSQKNTPSSDDHSTISQLCGTRQNDLFSLLEMLGFPYDKYL